MQAIAYEGPNHYRKNAQEGIVVEKGVGDPPPNTKTRISETNL